MAYLVLENGTVWEGERFGADGDCLAELVFTTGMVDYCHTLTDPSFANQIVVQTFPMVGNYGIIPEDIAPTATPCGYVVREHCETPSNFRCELTLDAYLKQQGVVGICGIDTRELTRILREEGTMAALICDEVPADLSALHSYKAAPCLDKVSRHKATMHPAIGESRYAVTVWDLGVKTDLIQALRERGCDVTCLPHTADDKMIRLSAPDALIIAGGPGDPRELPELLPVINTLFGKLPILGVGLGHQLIALARGGSVEKMAVGHRGPSQPVKGHHVSFLTEQNHGYTVTQEPNGTLMLYRNANDNTCEGIYYTTRLCLTVQFDPNALVLDRFFAMMGGEDRA